MSKACVALVVLVALGGPAYAQEPASGDGVATLVSRLEDMIRLGDRDELRALVIAPLTVADADRFGEDFFAPDIRRAVARERDRAPLQGALPGDGYRLVVEFFIEIADHARLLTARIDVRRPRDGGPESWRISDLERLSLVEGLYRLRLNADTQLAARDFSIESEDLRLTLQEGFVFPVESDTGVTGLVLLGRGEMRFSPPSETERGQIRIYAGADALVSSFDGAFVRINPDDYERQSAQAGLTRVVTDPRTARRAQEIFTRESPKSFNLDLSDMSSEQWYLVPQRGDFLADVRTRRFGTLTYARNQNQAEDITLFHRERRRTISIYPSADKLQTQGRNYDEDGLTDFDVVSYDIEANIDPEKEYVNGRARITVRSRSDYLATLTLRLADTIEVSNIVSPQFGRLLFLRVRNQNGVLVNLPSAIGMNSEITLIVTYAGSVAAQRVDAEAVAAGQDDATFLMSERSYLLSNRSYWYPQNSVNDYATARLRIGVPPGWGVVASGQLSVGSDTTLRDLLGPVGTGRSFTFTANEPVRYLSLVVSRFVRVADSTISLADTTTGDVTGAPGGRRQTMTLSVDANPRQTGRGREVAGVAEDVLRFYSTLMRDTPYPSMTMAVVENELPGGHSPAYATMLNNPPPASQFLWRNDPAAFLSYPEFFVAHEVAHQWWGQAVGWKNYHEQWISEGFAQYFSALYAQRSRGDAAFTDMLRQFRRWALAESEEGPVYLGYRLGHVKNDTRVFRALVYNKGAAVLHMLRRLMGDEAFFAGLRQFYTEQRFKKAGTDDFERAMEAASGMTLDRFFERWIYGSEVPRLRYSSTTSSGGVVVRFEQLNEALFDIPVTVTVTQSSGRVIEVVVPVTDRRVERTIPVQGGVRQVQVNRDSAAIAEIEGN